MNACLLSVIASATFTISYPQHYVNLVFQPNAPIISPCANAMAIVPVQIMVRPENQGMCFDVYLEQDKNMILAQEYNGGVDADNAMLVKPFVLEGGYDALNLNEPITGTIGLCQNQLPQDTSVSGSIEITGYGTPNSIMRP